MANDQNQCNFTGRLGADPELRTTPSGVSIVNANIAVGGRRKNGDGWEDTTEWVRLVFFNRTAEVVAKYAQKGSQIRVSGRFTTREWEKDGVKRSSSEILVNDLQLLGSRDSQGSSGGGQPPASRGGAPASPQTVPEVDFDDECPF